MHRALGPLIGMLLVSCARPPAPPLAQPVTVVKGDECVIAHVYIDVALADLPPLPPTAKESTRATVAASDAMVTKTAHDFHERTQAVTGELRGWVARGYLPSQSARRAAYERALAVQLDDDAIAGAAATARMQESLGLDWMQISSPECKYDPTMCAAAARQMSTGARLWFARAATNYQLCETLGARTPGYEAWARYCRLRTTELRHVQCAFAE